MTGGDETIIHNSSRTPGPLDTSTTGRLDFGRLVRARPKTPTLNYVSKEELNQFAGHLGGVLGIFSQHMAREQKSMYLDIGRLSSEGQQQARALGKLQRRLELGKSILVDEVNLFEKTIDMLDQESRTIPAEIMTKVEVEFQAQQARQTEQAEHSQRQDKQLRDRILEVEEARANDNANYVSVINRHKEEHKEAARDQQRRSEPEIAKLHDILNDLKAPIGAISVERSAAPTVITDNREQPVRNTDGATKKRSNATPEQGGNEGGQLPPTTMHGARDPTETMVTTMTTTGRIRKEARVAEKKGKVGRDKIPREGTRKKTSWTSWRRQSLENDCYIPNDPPTLHGYLKISPIRIFEYG